jgi:hypothetical protein
MHLIWINPGIEQLVHAKYSSTERRQGKGAHPLWTKLGDKIAGPIQVKLVTHFMLTVAAV